MQEALTPSNDQAVELLVNLFYADLQRIARRERGRLATPSATLGTTALVHEAYLKLARQGTFKDHGHFLSTASLAMRQALVSYARARLRDKRGGGQAAVDIEAVSILSTNDERLVALDEALNELEHTSPRLARVVECRYFAGYSEKETALALGIGERTVQRDWTMAKALLYKALGT